ncbi:SidA/IucD/PvdA family monooxygenase [Paraburkholderia sp. A1RI_3L]|uniref:SidA/IucD/PvdA family monooxygenase n=1 Tax=Paraburkholderia TaxID=1822464 RepID=UPI003B773411
MEGELLDCVAFGVGPSNLALAVAAREIDPARRMLLLERSPQVSWHPGMMLNGSRMQISFLKDLATLRNPSSPYTFLQYLKAKGRLERFTNLRDFHPSRAEYQDYLGWVAQAFAGQIRYGAAVRRVVAEPAEDGGPAAVLRVVVEDQQTRRTKTYRTRNVVCACGGKPRLPPHEGRQDGRVIHSSEFLHRFRRVVPDTGARYAIAVAGSGQSAAEITAHVLAHYPDTTVHLYLSGFSLHAADSNPFINEAFFAQQADAIYHAAPAQREAVLDELRVTNYGVVDADLIEALYRECYFGEVQGSQRLVVHRFTEIESTRDLDTHAELTVFIRDRSERVETAFDCIVLATGYTRQLDLDIFGPLLPAIRRDERGSPRLTREYRVETTGDVSAGLYFQGYGERSHGIGDTLLSLLPFRAREIIADIRRRSGADEARPYLPGAYPPPHHVEGDPERLYAVLEQFKFATLVSVGDGEPFVTHAPLTLDRSRGAMGVLFGHMDRSNPQIDHLDGQRVLVVFHGPNAYISPHVYKTDQLPTWNSIAVHVRGTLRLLRDPGALVRGLAGISKESGREKGAHRLDPDDPRIGRLIHLILGFEIEIDDMTGRFKLSQDRTDPEDRRRASQVLLEKTAPSHRPVVARLVDVPVHDGAPASAAPLHEAAEPAPK